ncbi:MAG: superoxide dismutase family protein [Thermoanaerobaculia bacterium]|nr:superoxide dismutase family protein [Thermoanaerobaculia bacterium]
MPRPSPHLTVIRHLGIGVLTLAFLAVSGFAGADGPVRARAEIRGCADTEITGSALFAEAVSPEGIKQVVVTIEVEGLSDGRHAVHVHETAACEPCGAAGGHHDPGPFGKSTPDAPDFNHPFHMGDLINIEVRNGRGTLETTTNRFTLSAGRSSLFDDDGSAVIIHTNEDAYCDQEDELEPGCAGGPRDACGIIESVEP